LIEIRGVSRTFAGRRGAEPVAALRDTSLSVAAGETVAIVGASGCGKTTLLELICGLQRPDAGSVQSAPAALMPQRDLLLPWLSAIDNAALALRAGDQVDFLAAGAYTASYSSIAFNGFPPLATYCVSSKGEEVAG
jgi:NitT/TauT family transport system ATP-binding protein